MRSLAARVGPGGQVVGLDADHRLVTSTEAALAGEGLAHCRVVAHDLTDPDLVPGGPYDVVLVRLVLFHLPQRDAVLRRLWRAVSPGGVLVVQDYVLGSITAVPEEAAVRPAVDLLMDAFAAAGCDINIGLRLPDLFRSNGLGEPDGGDLGCRVDPLAVGASMLERTCRSVLPGAMARGLVTAERADEVLDDLRRAADERPDRHLVWPLMAAAWKRAPVG
jgi:SAM-dependent methyltransferase